MRWWVAAAVVVCGAARAEAVELAVVDPETSVTQTQPVAGDGAIHLRAARGEREPALVVARPEHDGALPVKASRLVRVGGGALPDASVELSRVSFVNANGREVADRLDPLHGPLAARAGENALVWFQVAVPRGATPGTYKGTLQVADRSVPVELEVLPFTLPSTPSLATSLEPQHDVAAKALARAGLDERLTYRTLAPPEFRVRPLEGTLQLDFTRFDADLAALQGGLAGPSSIELSVPRRVPAPRRLAYLVAVKEHLARRGLGDLLVSFGEDGLLLDHVDGAPDVPSVALVSASDGRDPASRFWWKLGGRAEGALEDSADWLRPGASPRRVRAIGWAAFAVGARGLGSSDALPLFYVAEDGTVRASVRAEMLRKGLEDYEYLVAASKVDPLHVAALAQNTTTGDGTPTTRAIDLQAQRDALIRLVALPRQARRVARMP